MVKRLKVALLLVAIVALVAAGCGDDGDDGGDAGNGNGGANAPSGEPVRIGVMSPCESETLQFCDVGRIAAVAEQAVNDAGGVQGRPLEVVYCDDQDDPNTAAQCANQLVEDGIVSAVGGSGRQGEALWSELIPAGIPWFGQIPVVAQDFSEETSFPFGSGIAVFFNFPLALEGQDAASASVVHSDTPSGQAVFGFAEQGYGEAGVTEVESIAIDPATVDYQPVVARLQQSDPDVWTSAQAASQTVALVETAADLGFTTPMVMSSASLDTEVVETTAATDVPLNMVLSFPVSEDNERVQQFNDEVDQYGDDVEDTFSDPTISTWLAVHMFAEIAEGLDEITAEAFTEYVSSNPIDTGMIPQLDFTQPGPMEDYPRIVNVYALPAVREGDQVVQTSDEFATAVPGAPAPVQP